MQDVISALLGMLPSRTSSVASLHRWYEGDIESSDDPHEVDSSIEERPRMHANRAMKHELGRHFAVPCVRWVCVVREGASCSPLPCHPTTLCRTPAAPAASVSSISAPCGATPIMPVAASTSALAVAAPSAG